MFSTPSATTCRCVSLTLLLGACLLLVGCGPRNNTVKGKVTFKDGKPLRTGIVVFSMVGNPEVKASGEIDENGAYELGNSQGMGAIEGEYEVAVQPIRPPDNPQEGTIAQKYQRFETSELKYTVKSGTNEFNIEIERNPRPQNK
jgi:hypothetical protein